MKNLKWFYLFIFVGSFIFLGWRAVKEGLIYQSSVAEVIDGPISQGAFRYQNSTSGYSISFPSNWGYSQAEEDNAFESRVEIIPPPGELKVTSINIEVMKPGLEAMALSREDEFASWDEAESDTEKDGITKLGEETISQHKILILADLTNSGEDEQKNNWSILGWFRDKDRNFYVRMFGRQNFEDSDEQVFRYLLRTMDVE